MTSGASFGGGIVGPDAALCSSPFGTSETIKLTCAQSCARAERPPPLMAENVRRTELISLIDAPEFTKA